METLTNKNILHAYMKLVKYPDHSTDVRCWRSCGWIECWLRDKDALDLKGDSNTFNKREIVTKYNGFFGKEKEEVHTETYVEFIKRCTKDYLIKEDIIC